MSSSSDGSRPPAAGGLDIRIPMGLFFTVVGVVLAGYGMASDVTVYERSLGHNVNLWWGLVLVMFGVLLLWLSRRRRGG